MESFGQLPDWSPEQVASWIRALNLNALYPQSFEENEISGDVLAHADHDMLKELGVLSVGHRVSILRGVYDVKVRQGVPFEEFDFVPPPLSTSSPAPPFHPPLSPSASNSPVTPTADKERRILHTQGPGGLRGDVTPPQPTVSDLLHEISRINRELVALREAVAPVQSLVREVEILRAHLSNPSLPTPYSLSSTSSSTPTPFSVASGEMNSHYSSTSTAFSSHSAAVSSGRSFKTAPDDTDREPMMNGSSTISPNTPTAGGGIASAGASGGTSSLWSAVSSNPSMISPGPASPTISASESVIVRVVGHYLQRDGEQQKYMKCQPTENAAGVIEHALKRFKLRDEGGKYGLSSLYQGIERTIQPHERPLALVPIPTAPNLISEQTPTFLLRRQQPPSDAVATQHYIAQKTEDITLRAGDRVRVLSKDPAGWWYVEGPTGGAGWVPAVAFGHGGGTAMGFAMSGQQASPVAQTGSLGGTQGGSGSVSSSASRPGDDDVPKGTYAIATFDYNARATNELSIKKGDRVDVMRKHGAWYLGVLGSVKGWIPSTYVTLHQKSGGSVSSSRSQGSQSQSRQSASGSRPRSTHETTYRPTSPSPLGSATPRLAAAADERDGPVSTPSSTPKPYGQLPAYSRDGGQGGGDLGGAQISAQTRQDIEVLLGDLAGGDQRISSAGAAPMSPRPSFTRPVNR
ncbi:hypothetical protein M427DRAFT_63019 [Gonapodya prolifera JEL478]|uniref:RA-domain-containing protein n=1 Tax=Gonapodya prolifera (strain JEL478) TaxID=1344416 RepID=A0A139A032_GONPJ|nr:hypothetical protein M427DRAFT_63019 [Gonapodya prolifera JEL478]|eukprot:KXS10084.1 hypothetical protein M427DRAFT_63019 [Gonapodya prolifera JEL478]